MKKNLLALILLVSSSLILASGNIFRNLVIEKAVPTGQVVPAVREELPSKLTPSTQKKLASTLGITKKTTVNLAHATTVVITCCSDEVKDKEVTPLIRKHFPQLSASERSNVVKHIMTARHAAPADTATPINEITLAIEVIANAVKAL